MLTRNAADTTITLYNFVLYERASETPPRVAFTYKRTVINDCVWTQDSELAYKKTGTANPDAISVLVPYSYDYVSTLNGGLYNGDGWTVQLGADVSASYVVKGDCPFEFPVLSGEWQPVTDAERYEQGMKADLTSAEFFKSYIQPFERQYRYSRPKELVERFTGSRQLWRLEVRA